VKSTLRTLRDYVVGTFCPNGDPQFEGSNDTGKVVEWLAFTDLSPRQGPPFAAVGNILDKAQRHASMGERISGPMAHIEVIRRSTVPHVRRRV